MNGIACDETRSRACAFDAYLVTHGPVRLRDRASFDTEHSFIYYNDTYYRRIHRDHEANDSVTYDVERIRSRELLAGIAVNLSEDSEDHLRSHWTTRLVVTGEAKTSFKEPFNSEGQTPRGHIRDQWGVDTFNPDEEEFGTVYRYNGNYYTVMVSGGDNVDYPVFSPGMRGGLIIIGVGLWIIRL